AGSRPGARVYADGAGLHDRQREHGLLAENQRVERITVVAVRPRYEPVVGRVMDCAVEDAIEPEEPRGFIELVLVLAALRDLDDDRKDFRNGGFADGDVVPRMHRVENHSIQWRPSLLGHFSRAVLDRCVLHPHRTETERIIEASMAFLELAASSGLGSLLGMRHALEPDHLAAVSTLVTTERSGYKAALLGVCWGLGHTLSLVAVGTALV